MHDVHKLSLADKLTLGQLLQDGKTIVSRGLNLSQVIQLNGLSFYGMTDEDITALMQMRHHVFKDLKDTFSIQVHYQRKHMVSEEVRIDFPNKYLKGMHQKNLQLVQNSYRTDLYMVLTECQGPATCKLPNEDAVQDNIRARLNELNVKASEITAILSKYGAHILTNDTKESTPVLDFWSYLVNVGHSIATPRQVKHLNAILATTNIEIDERKGLVTLSDGETTRYAAMLRINAYPEETYQELLDGLSQVRHQFSIIQQVNMLDDQKITERLSKEFNSVASLTTNRLGQALNLDAIFRPKLNDLNTAMTQVGDKLRLGQHTLSILVYGDTESHLGAGLQRIKNALAQHNITATRETENLDNAFWSQFPDLESFNAARRFIVSSFDLTNFITFSKTSEGFNKCSWGMHPVATFLTPEETAYNFIFQENDSTQSTPNGNTLIVGKSGAGKTTLAMYLIQNALKYTNPGFGAAMRVLLFDSGEGARIPVKAMDGDYINVGNPKKLPLNPFLMPDSEANTLFLERWVTALAGGRDAITDVERNAITAYVRETLNLPLEARNLGGAIPVLTNIDYKGVDTTTLYEKLEKWLPPFNGNKDSPLSTFFNARRDALAFNKQVVGVDMKAALRHGELLTPLAMYIFHAFGQTVNKEPGPNIVFFDEMRQYLQNDVIGEYINHSVEEIRKRRGVFIGAMQDPSHLQGKYKDSLLQNIATLILLPSNNASWLSYKEIGCNEAEFDWIKNNDGKRQALIKKGNQSIVISTDFSYLGDYLHLLSGDLPHAAEMARLEESIPDYEERIDAYLRWRSGQGQKA